MILLSITVMPTARTMSVTACLCAGSSSVTPVMMTLMITVSMTVIISVMVIAALIHALTHCGKVSRISGRAVVHPWWSVSLFYD